MVLLLFRWKFKKLILKTFEFHHQTPVVLIFRKVKLELIYFCLLLDFEFFQSWYVLDKNYHTPIYKLRPLIDAFPNFYNKYFYGFIS